MDGTLTFGGEGPKVPGAHFLIVVSRLFSAPFLGHRLPYSATTDCPTGLLRNPAPTSIRTVRTTRPQWQVREDPRRSEHSPVYLMAQFPKRGHVHLRLRSTGWALWRSSCRQPLHPWLLKNEKYVLFLFWRKHMYVRGKSIYLSNKRKNLNDPPSHHLERKC